MKRTLLLSGAALSAVVGLRRRISLAQVPASLAAEQVDVEIGSGWTVTAYSRGPERERPVVMVHSVNAAASAAEMRPLFDRLSSNRRVIAVDLLGYGRSSRPNVRYTPELMADGIGALLDTLEQPADVVALSLGCEFTARVARERPDKVRTLTLISPTGLQGDQARSFSLRWLGNAIRSPVLGEAIYGVLASRRSIDYFLSRSFEGEIDPDVANHAYLTARHRDARFAPASFLEGVLFTPRAVRTLYEPLEMPILVIADRDAYTDFGALDGLIARRGNWQHHRLAPHRGLPHFDHPEATAELILSFQGG